MFPEPHGPKIATPGGTTAHLSCFPHMSGKGAHINVLGERIRRYYEHLMADAHTFVDGLRKDLEGPHPPRPDAMPGTRSPASAPSTQTHAAAGSASPAPSPGSSSQPGKRAH